MMSGQIYNMEDNNQKKSGIRLFICIQESRLTNASVTRIFETIIISYIVSLVQCMLIVTAVGLIINFAVIFTIWLGLNGWRMYLRTHRFSS
jgi:hypothetical protein